MKTISLWPGTKLAERGTRPLSGIAEWVAQRSGRLQSGIGLPFGPVPPNSSRLVGTSESGVGKLRDDGLAQLHHVIARVEVVNSARASAPSVLTTQMHWVLSDKAAWKPTPSPSGVQVGWNAEASAGVQGSDGGRFSHARPSVSSVACVPWTAWTSRRHGLGRTLRVPNAPLEAAGFPLPRYEPNATSRPFGERAGSTL